LILEPTSERLSEPISVTDMVVRSSFAISTLNAVTPEIKTPLFRRSLKSAEQLAAMIASSRQFH
jgi:hypothetical protein